MNIMKRFNKFIVIAFSIVIFVSSVPISSFAIKTTRKEICTQNISTGIKIKWGKTNKSTKYKVYRSNSKNKGFKLIGKTKKSTFLDTKAKSGKTYFYTVKTNTDKYKVSKIVRLTTPFLKKVNVNEVDDTVSLKWTKVKGAKSYKIYSAIVKDGKPKKYKYLSMVNTNSTKVAIDSIGTHKFKIIAVKGTSESKFSNTKKITIKNLDTEEMKNQIQVTLVVDGKELLAKNYVEFIEDYAMLPLLSIIRELGGETKWQNETTVAISYDNKKYLLNTETADLVYENDDYFHFIAGIPGRDVHYQVIDEEFVLDHITMKYFLTHIGCEVNVDFENSIVTIKKSEFEKYTLLVNGNNISEDSEPKRKLNIYYVPLVSVLEELGYEVRWEAERKATIIKDGQQFILDLSVPSLVDNNLYEYIMPLPGGQIYYETVEKDLILDDTTSKALFESFGCDFTLNREDSTIIINS